MVISIIFDHTGLTYSLKIWGWLYIKTFSKVFNRASNVEPYGSNFCPFWNFRMLTINNDFELEPYPPPPPARQSFHARKGRYPRTKTETTVHCCVPQKRYGIDLRLRGLEAGNSWAGKIKNSLVFFWLLEFSYTSQR